MYVPRNHGVIGHAEVILDLVKISVADSTEGDFDVYIFRACVSANIYTYIFLNTTVRYVTVKGRLISEAKEGDVFSFSLYLSV